MNFRFAIFFVFACAAAGAVHAEEKLTPAPKTEKSTPAPKMEKSTPMPKMEKSTPMPKMEKLTPTPKTEKPNVLIFEPSPKLPGAGPADAAPKTAATPSPVLEGPAQVVGTFFGSLEAGKVEEAYATLTKGSKIAERPEELRQLKTKTHEAIEAFGAILGYDLVESKAIGSRLVRATYVSLGKVFPLRWRFYFYKPEDVWRLIDLRVDDKLTGIFDEAEEAKAPESSAAQP